MNVVLFSFMDPTVSYGASLSSSSSYAIGPNSVYNSRQRTEGHSAELGGALGQGDWYQSNNERILENMAASMLSQSKLLFCAFSTSRLALSMLTLL